MGDVGSDSVGEMLLQDLRKSGIAALAGRKPGLDTGVVISRIGRRGNRTMHSARWAAAAFDVDSLPLGCAARERFTSRVTRPRRPGLKALEAVFSAANSAGAFLSFDPSHAGIVRTVGAPRLLDLLVEATVNVIFANRSEAAALAGSSSARESAPILAQSARMAIVKDGGRGCYAAGARSSTFRPCALNRWTRPGREMPSPVRGWRTFFSIATSQPLAVTLRPARRALFS